MLRKTGRQEPLLAEMIQKLDDLIRKAQTPSVFVSEHDPGKIYLAQNGELKTIDRPCKAITSRLESYRSLTEFVQDLKTNPEVYVCFSGVQVVLDLETRREVVSVPLIQTARFAWAASLIKGDALTVKETIYQLRFVAGLPASSPVVRALSKIEFKRRSDGSSEVAHGKETLGRSVELEVRQAADIPEEFTYTCDVFQNLGFSAQASIAIGVYLDIEGERIRLVANPDNIQRARNLAVVGVLDEMRITLPSTLLYHGAP